MGDGLEMVTTDLEEVLNWSGKRDLNPDILLPNCDICVESKGVTALNPAQSRTKPHVARH
jgi:hypothetical protein